MCGRVSGLLATLALGLAYACGPVPDVPPSDASVPLDAPLPSARRVSMDYESASFYAAPFPGEHLRDATGEVDVSGAQNPLASDIVDQIHVALRGIDGFGTSSPIHFHLDGDIDRTQLPDAFASLERESPILLVDVDPSSPERGTLRPFDAHFQADAGPYGDTFFLTLLPVQGMPLRPTTLYAAVITDSLRAADGVPLERASAMRTLSEGSAPPGMSASAHAAFVTAIDSLGESGIAVDRIVGMTAFRTGDPLEVLRRAIAASEGRFTPEPVAPLEAREVFDTYCVFEGSVRMPVFQEGAPPYLEGEGGGWVLDDDGAPVQQRDEDARLWVTVPRSAMPAAGFPTAMLVRTGAGGDRPLVDRGVRDETGASIVPGTGPALDFARVGFAGVSVEGPHGGSRNVSGADEQFLVFNIQNPIALRDNLRQSALELVLLARALDTMTFDASSCPGLTTEAGDGAVRFDTAHMALMGHSMGASIAPLAAAFEPRFGALVLSGAGGSWIENVIHKELPIATRPLAELMLRYRGRTLTVDDPALGLLQWAGEAADAQLYARLLVEAPELGPARHVLMFQGIVDHYILPPIANALSLSLAVDLVGPGLDATTIGLAAYTPIEDLLPLRSRSAIALPAIGNFAVAGGTAVTAVVAQHVEDGLEDGHETVFQTEPPKAQYRCFLRTFARDEMPIVPDPAALHAACAD